jgi:Flp pilus assembly protein TadB
MNVARHPRAPELVGVPLEEIMKRYVGRFRDRKALGRRPDAFRSTARASFVCLAASRLDTAIS